MSSSQRKTTAAAGRAGKRPRAKMLCKHCRAGDNFRAEKGLLVRSGCDSCRIRFTTRGDARCEGSSPACRRTTWVDELGLPTPLCEGRHQWPP